MIETGGFGDTTVRHLPATASEKGKGTPVRPSARVPETIG